MAKKLILFLIFIVEAFLLPKTVLSTDFNSTNFKVRDPVISVSNATSSSSSFKLTGAIGQIAIGTSSSGSFQAKSGWLFFSTAAPTPAPTPAAAAAAGNFSMYLESLAKAILYPLPILKPGAVSFDFNGDNKVDIKDFSVFLASMAPLSSSNRVEFNKNLSVLLYSWTSPIFSFFEKQIMGSAIGQETSQPKTLFFFKENVASIFSLKKEPVAATSSSAPKPTAGKPGIIKTAVQFISNIFNKFIKLFVK